MRTIPRMETVRRAARMAVSVLLLFTLLPGLCALQPEARAEIYSVVYGERVDEKTIQMKNGFVYTGYADVNDRPRGSGKLTGPDGSYASGFWLDGSLQYGVMMTADGTRYVGEFKNGELHGNGVEYILNENFFRVGQWQNGRLNGQGAEIYTELYDKERGVIASSFYIGSWSNGRRSGQGTWFSFPSDRDNLYRFTGSWLDADIGGSDTGSWFDTDIGDSGTGWYSYGYQYTGQWSDGKPAGPIASSPPAPPKDLSQMQEKHYSDGSEYTGYLVDGKIREGYGICIYSNGGYYEGSWKKDKRSGYGTFHYASGAEYDGYWKDDKLSGYGAMTFKNGNCYRGEFADGHYEGYGLFFQPDGYKAWGQYKGDKRNGTCVLYYANGDVYFGNYVNDQRHGTGMFISADGEVKSGQWKNGEFVG